MEDEVQDYNDVQGMISHAMDQDWNNANKIFGDIMTMKVQDMLDQEKVRLADQIYNGAEPDDEEQLELDLEDDVTDEEIEVTLEDDEDELEEYEFGPNDDPENESEES